MVYSVYDLLFTSIILNDFLFMKQRYEREGTFMATDEKVERRRKEGEVIDLVMLMHDCFRGLKKFWWVIAILAAVTTAAALVTGMLLYKPMYQSEASFTVSTSASSSGNYDYLFDYNRSTAERMATTFPYILESDLLIDLVEQDLGVEEIDADISASAVSNTNLFTFTVTSETPEESLEVLQSVIRNYPEVSRYVIGNTKLNMIEEPVLAQRPCNEINSIRRGAKGFLLGIGIGICFIFLYALTRKTVRTEEEIQDGLDVQCLGIVPEVVFKKRNLGAKQELSICNKRIGDYFREPVRSMALHLVQQMSEKEQKILMVTSTLPGEGVTTISRNLAFAMAEMEKKVILLDMGSVERLKKMSGDRERPDPVLAQEPDSGVWFLDCPKNRDDRHENPPAQTTSGSLKKLLTELQETADFIVIDALPCTCMSEVACAAECSDLILYVIQQDCAKKGRIMEGLENICSYGASLAGCVLNRIQNGSLSGYGYGRYGKYGYGGYSYGKYGYGSYGYGNYGYGRRYGTYESRTVKEKHTLSTADGIEKRGERG